MNVALVEHRVWDRTTRLFHWLNVLCVLGLISVGTVILYAGDLGIPSDGKIALKTLHVWIGYAFLVNLLWRLVWGFIGGPYARWSALLPGGKGYTGALVSYVKGFMAGESNRHVGHNPLGRIAATALLGVLLVQGVSGLILAGTDVYMPPFGGYFAEWAASPDMDPAQVKPYAPDTVNEASYKEMRAFRAPVIKTHFTTYFVLLALIALHIIAVVVTDVREGGAIVSAMFTGRKLLASETGEPPRSQSP